MKTVDDLFGKLKEIEDLVSRNAAPDGSCQFDSLKVYILLQAAANQILETESDTNA